MDFAWRGLYGCVGVPLMWAGMHVGALFDEKARQVVAGRRGWRASLSEQLANCREGSAESRALPTLWFHATSVGEFEQARPLIAALHSSYRIVVTRFSPSVQRAMTRHPQVDASITLPLDSRRNVADLLEMIRPRALIFSKFDVWPNCVWEASRRGVPVALIAGTMHSGSRRLRPIARGLLRQVHRHFSVQCAVTEEDAARLRTLSPADAPIIVTGDTRFDQVFARAESSSTELALSRDDWSGFTLVAGSTYEQDERVLIPAFKALREAVPDARLILVPHEPTAEHLDASDASLRTAGLTCIRYSDADAGVRVDGVDVVLVDRVGVLAALYRLGSVAFVGGSFRARVHNVMEPAALSKPVIVGPLMDNSPECYGLLRCGGALRVPDEASLSAALIDLARGEGRVSEMGATGRAYIVENLGASERTLAALRAWVL